MSHFNKILSPQPIRFQSDGYRLQGYLHLPPVLDPPIVIGSHGLMASSRSPKLLALARQCNLCGMAFFRFDHRGCGDSEGEFKAVTTLTGRRNDILNAWETLRNMGHAKNGIGLFGSSLGGAASLSAAGLRPVDALVIYAAPIRSEPIQVARKELSDDDDLATLYETRLHYDIRKRLASIRNILIFQGDADPVVPVSHAKHIYRQARRPKRIIIQKGGDHPMSRPAHQQAFVREAVYWFRIRMKGSRES